MILFERFLKWLNHSSYDTNRNEGSKKKNFEIKKTPPREFIAGFEP
jgi:hypothetical protein